MAADLEQQLEQAIDAMNTQVNAARELTVRTTEDIVIIDERLDVHDTIFNSKADVGHGHFPTEVGFPVNFPTVTSDAINLVQSTTLATSTAVSTLNAKVDQKADLVGGKIPTSQLPGFVDDVESYSAKVSFPTIGESDKIYIDEATNQTYRWGGSSYVVIGGDLALGETFSTAYRGDRGKLAYDHSLSDHLALGESATTAYQGDRGKIAYDHSQSSHISLGESNITAYRGDRGKVAYDHSQSAHLALGVTSATAYRGDRGAAAYTHAISAHFNPASNNTITGTWTFTKEVFSNVDFTVTSDGRLKENKDFIDDALEKIGRISGYTYDRIDNPEQGRMAGVIAQQIEEVLPEAVTTKFETGMKSVRYSGIVALLIEGVKELKAENEQLRKQFEELKNERGN